MNLNGLKIQNAYLAEEFASIINATEKPLQDEDVALNFRNNVISISLKHS